MLTSGGNETSGMTDAPAHIVYIDANPIAYALEGPEELASALKALFSLFKKKPGIAITSELTLAEVLPKRKVPDRQFLELLVWSEIFELRPVSRDILVETADYRRIARTKLPDGRIAMPKLPDAIHVVTTIRNSCQIFLSSDMRIKLPDTMRLVRADTAGVTRLAREIA
jgi:predicted nucleic acid-binding protein